jgi:hypothetical protein
MDLGSLRLGAAALASVAAALGIAGLAAVGLVSWARTRPLRTGHPPVPGTLRADGDGTRPTSRATLLAGAAGMALAITGLVALLPGAPPVPFLGSSRLPAVLVVTGGGFVALTGLVWRVTSLATTPEDLSVGYAWRRPARIAWSGVERLRPPATPLGGWRILGQARHLTLMPSDMFGHEEVLGLLVRRAGLRFDGRAWVREP